MPNIPIVASDWERVKGVACVVCPKCAFTFSADHTGPDGKTYDCPECQVQESFHGFVARTHAFLRHYPLDIFTGESGDPGPIFTVALHGAIMAYERACWKAGLR